MKNNFLLSEDDFLYCYVTNAKIDPKGNYKQPLFVDCKCQFGRVNFVFWLTENIANFEVENTKTWPINKNQFIKVSITNLEKAQKDLQDSLGKNNNKYPTFALQGRYKSNFDYRIINEEDVPENIIKLIKIDRSKQISDAKNAITDESYWNNNICADILKQAILSCPKFINAPAAVGHHHDYESGLLIHSYEVWKTCKVIADLYEELYPGSIDKDVLYLSAWLHDIGKTEVYSIDENGQCIIDSQKETLMNHIIRSNTIFIKISEKHNLDPSFIDNVSHCILGHHDRKDWSTPIEPKTVEAVILARADKISSVAAR